MSKSINSTTERMILREPWVYYVSSPSDSSVTVALDLKIEDGVVKWFDTVKERIMEVERIIDISSDHFVFARDDKSKNNVYTFVPLTLEIYNQNVKNRILIPQDFESEEDMLQAFERTIDNAW